MSGLEAIKTEWTCHAWRIGRALPVGCISDLVSTHRRPSRIVKLRGHVARACVLQRSSHDRRAGAQYSVFQAANPVSTQTLISRQLLRLRPPLRRQLRLPRSQQQRQPLQAQLSTAYRNPSPLHRRPSHRPNLPALPSQSLIRPKLQFGWEKAQRNKVQQTSNRSKCEARKVHRTRVAVRYGNGLRTNQEAAVTTTLTLFPKLFEFVIFINRLRNGQHERGLD